MKKEKRTSRWVYEYEHDEQYRRTWIDKKGKVVPADASGVRYVLGEIFEDAQATEH